MTPTGASKYGEYLRVKFPATDSRKGLTPSILSSRNQPKIQGSALAMTSQTDWPDEPCAELF